MTTGNMLTYLVEKGVAISEAEVSLMRVVIADLHDINTLPAV